MKNLFKMHKRVVGLAIAGCLAGTPSFAFQPGQNWSCTTDQGAAAFLAVLDVDGDAVTFSWGAIDTKDGSLMSLCNKRDALSLEEMKTFCTLETGSGSNGHARLTQACANE